MRRSLSLFLALSSTIAFVACQQRGEPELSLTQEQWRRVRTDVLPELPVEEIETPLNIRFGDVLVLRGVSGLNTQVQAGSALPLTLYWEILQETRRPVNFRLGLTQGELSDWESHIALRGQFPSRMWETGTILRDRVDFQALPMFSGATHVDLQVLADDVALPIRRSAVQDQATSGTTTTLDEATARLGRVIVIWDPPRISARWTDQRIVIDGHATESAWTEAPKTSAWRNPIDGSAFEGQDSTAQLLWSDEGLYGFFTLRDEHIWSTLMGRDQSLWEEENVEIFLDPQRDGRNYLEIQVNPLNTVFDAVFESSENRDLQKAKAHNLSGLRTAVSVSGSLNNSSDRDDRWTVEMFIPFAEIPDLSINDAGIPSSTSVNFYRYDRPDRDTLETSAWSPVGPGSFHRTERFGIIHWVGRPVAAPANDDASRGIEAPKEKPSENQ